MTKDRDKITSARKNARYRLSFNAYQIKKAEIPLDYATMKDEYYQSLQSLIQTLDDAYLYNIGNGDYKTVQARMQEVEEKSDEYFRLFVQKLITQEPQVYYSIKAISENYNIRAGSGMWYEEISIGEKRQY